MLCLIILLEKDWSTYDFKSFLVSKVIVYDFILTTTNEIFANARRKLIFFIFLKLYFLLQYSNPPYDVFCCYIEPQLQSIRNVGIPRKKRKETQYFKEKEETILKF